MANLDRLCRWAGLFLLAVGLSMAAHASCGGKPSAVETFRAGQAPEPPHLCRVPLARSR